MDTQSDSDRVDSTHAGDPTLSQDVLCCQSAIEDTNTRVAGHQEEQNVSPHLSCWQSPENTAYVGQE